MLFLWAYVKLHIRVYRETVLYLESTERLSTMPVYCVTVCTVCTLVVCCRMLSLSKLISNEGRRPELELHEYAVSFVIFFFRGNIVEVRLRLQPW
jgi:hypothetical protein